MRPYLLIFFLILTSWGAKAQKMPLLTDTTVTTTAEILNRIQENSVTHIKAKYSDLQKNYTPHFLTTGLDLDCRTGEMAAAVGAQYAGLRVSNDAKTLADGTVQTSTTISHYDCFGQLVFTEVIKVLAPAAVPMSVPGAAKFSRHFEVQPGETARQYHVENGQSETAFSVRSQRVQSESTGERIYSVIEVGSEKWLELDQLDFSQNERRLYIRMYSGVFRVGPQSKYRMNYQNGLTVLKTFWTQQRMEHFIDDSVTSQVSFDSNLAHQAVGLTTQMLSQIYSGFISRFPQTKKVQAGVSDSPFLRELQLNYNRMLTSSEPEQVKFFFQKTIEDIQSGRIKVDQ